MSSQTRFRLLPICILLFLLLLLLVGSARPTFAQSTSDYLWPYNEGTSITYNENDVYSAWTDWKAANITSNNAGGNGRLRVMGGVDGNSTVSEGMAYGVLFASLFDDQATFDGLWFFIEDHMDANGLMDWYIGNPGQRLGSGAATDAEADMAQALINACVKVEQGAWSASANGIDYCQEAADMIDAMWETEVDKSGYELLPGDMWDWSEYPDGIVNLSYFAPGYFDVYAQFTNNNGWYDVIDRQYQLTDAAQAKSDNCSGLVPNWNQYDGDPQLVSWQPNNYEWWSYDAARFAWRIAVDNTWYDRPEAAETMNEIGSFFADIGMSNLGEHSMDGQLQGGGPWPFFVANAGVAVWSADNLQGLNCGAANGSIVESPQSAYNAVLNTSDNPTSYYGDAWRLFSMLLMTGNFPNFYEMANSGGVPATPTSVPVTPTTVPTYVPPTAVPTTAPTTVPTTAPTSVPSTGGGACSVAYNIDNQWSSGYTVQVVLTNTSSNAIDGYDLTWTYANGEQIGSGWNVVLAQSGANATASNPAGFWNGQLQPGGTSSFGFNVTHNGTFSIPTDYAINGVACGGSAPAATATTVAPTATSQPATATPVPPTATAVPATATPLPATATPVPATATAVPPTAVPTTPPTSSSTSCEVAYGIANDWGSGFQAGVAIVNTGTTPIVGWELTWTYPSGQAISSLWNADWGQTGANVSISNPASAWNGTIQPGAEVGFGFTANSNGTNTLPVQFMVNGVVCDAPDTSALRVAQYAKPVPTAVTLNTTETPAFSISTWLPMAVAITLFGTVITVFYTRKTG